MSHAFLSIQLYIACFLVVIEVQCFTDGLDGDDFSIAQGGGEAAAAQFGGNSLLTKFIGQQIGGDGKPFLRCALRAPGFVAETGGLE